MKEEIFRHLQDPHKLEELFRKDKSTFRRIFTESAHEMQPDTARDFWLARLEAEKADSISWGKAKDWYQVLIYALTGGIILKMPVLFHLEEGDFYPRNLVFAFVPGLFVLLAKQNKLSTLNISLSLLFMGFLALYINLLPGPATTGDSFWLVCLHMPVLFWLLLTRTSSGGGAVRNPGDAGVFIRFSAELLVMCALMVAAGGLFTGILLGLFEAIGIHIQTIYFEWFGVFGAAAIPLTAAHMLKGNPGLLKQVAPVVAGVFSPLVLLALLIFLPAMLLSGKNLYSDREFLLVFNLLLLGTLSLIFFSLPEIQAHPHKRAAIWVLTLLSCLCLLINGLAVSAIFYRIFEFGISANRAAVLGSNLLILSNLLMVTWLLARSIKAPYNLHRAGDSISRFLPLYAVWALVVIFLFPILF